jgi:tRNA-splicing ligase RtcB (3'-phosphate/5'-hydroxy nucleic acid ligase)
MIKERIQKIDEYIYFIPKHGNMLVPAEIIMSESLFEGLEEDAIQQIINVASLPGIYQKSLAMPDCHKGYGFTIGGVAAIDKDNGCISPGGIGFDINCGVRLLSTNLSYDEIHPKINELLDLLFKNVPCGVGKDSSLKLSDKDLDEVLKKGSGWAFEKGYGSEDDLIYCEELGCMKDADAKFVSSKAKARGRNQLGTLGSGNHFLEIQIVDEIFDEKAAEIFGIYKKGQVMVMIHSGSRGLGHQVCSDYLRKMEDAYPEVISKLPEKDLIYAPSGSSLANSYFSAMCASANFAWANRHIIADKVRKSFSELFSNVKINLVYDVAHNIAKVEDHIIDGVKRTCFVHRKGATRAFGPGHKEIPEKYRKIGQPIILPGSMGTFSYLLSGTKKAEEETFASTAHGAGRVMSRIAAVKQFRADSVKKDLNNKDIQIKAASFKGISEEAPEVYKDIEEVVKVSKGSGIGNVVAKFKPIGVIKG